MVQRFRRGSVGRRLLLEELRRQPVVRGDPSVAQFLVAHGTLRPFDASDVLIRQGDATNSIFFLIAGAVTVRVHRRLVAERVSGQHVGEMSLIESGASRSATVIANEPTVALEVKESDFSRLASRKPDVWRWLAAELSARLRGRHVRPANSTPSLLILSSTESIQIANSIRRRLRSRRLKVRIWTDRVFRPGRGFLESLCAAVEDADLAVAVYTPDDKTTSRGTTKRAARDNVIFELGLAIGTLGRERAFMLRPRGVDLKIPSDYAGVTPLEYTHTPRPHRKVQLDAACEGLRHAAAALGPR